MNRILTTFFPLAALLLVSACKPRSTEPGQPIEPSSLVTSEASPLLRAMGGELGRSAREFDEGEASDEFKALADRFWREPNERAEILERLETEFYTRDLLPFLDRLVQSGNAEWIQYSIDLLAGNTSSEILPVLERCLSHADEEVRQAAVSAASLVRSDALVPFLEKAFSDPSSEVRMTFFNEMEGQTDAVLLRVHEKALAAPHGDVREAGLAELELMSNQRSLDMIFGALDSPHPETKMEAQAVVDFLIDQEFTSAAQARAWWKANRHRFSQDLILEE